MDGDTGTGVLDVFDRYNFTVNEAEPSKRKSPLTRKCSAKFSRTH